MNQTTQIRKIVEQFIPDYLMYNDKRKDGTRRLKFIIIKKSVVNKIGMVELINNQCTQIGINVNINWKRTSTGCSKYNYLEIVYNT